MKTRIRLVAGSVALVSAGLVGSAYGDDLASLQKELSALQLKVENLEKADAAPNESSAVPKFESDEYPGFIQFPGSGVIMQFNAKVHVDATMDSGYAGSDKRFITAKIPVTGDPNKGGGEQFNINANGTQLRWDARAPNAPGNPRFYYQNDFFGSDDKDMQYRLQHAYFEIYNIKAGFTHGLFEDPDSWPDTVDYEGPNAVNFARRPLIHYNQKLSDDWNATFGIEQADYYVDTGFDISGNDANAKDDTAMPDIGANIRWKKAETGHMSLAGIVRYIGVNDTDAGNQSEMGWGVNLGASYYLTSSDKISALVNVGEGVAGMGNDTSFANSDAAINAAGELEVLPYYSGLVAFTHNWNPKWRSTATCGYVNLDSDASQDAKAYKETLYTSVNVICQIQERFSVGLEGLYGSKETKDGSDGDVFRLQLGMVYSVF